MRIIELQAFKFSELKPEIQEKVLDEHRYINTETYDYTDGDWMNEELKEIGLSCDMKKICFDLYRGEFEFGSSLSIEDEQKFMFSILSAEEKLRYALENKFRDVDLSIGRTGRVGIEDCSNNETETDYSDFEERYNNLIESYEHKFLKALREEEDYLTSDESIKDTIESNDYEFEENGERI